MVQSGMSRLKDADVEATEIESVQPDADALLALPPLRARRAARPMSEEHKAKIAEGVRRRWQEPEFQAKVKKGHAATVRVQTPEGNQARSNFQHRYWSEPPAERLAHIKSIHFDRTGIEHRPESKRKISEKMAGRTLSPEHKEKIRQARLATVARKREAKAAALMTTSSTTDDLRE